MILQLNCYVHQLFLLDDDFDPIEHSGAFLAHYDLKALYYQTMIGRGCSKLPTIGKQGPR